MQEEHGGPRTDGQEGQLRLEHRHRRERRSWRWPGHAPRHSSAPPVMPPVWPAAGLAGRRTVLAAPPSGQRQCIGHRADHGHHLIGPRQRQHPGHHRLCPGQHQQAAPGHDPVIDTDQHVNG